MNLGTCFVHIKKTYSKCSSLLSSSEPNSAYQTPSGETLEERLQLTDRDRPLRSPHRRTTTQADKPAIAPQGHLYRCVPEPFLAKNGRNGIFKDSK
jgi:hypothetical protein